MLVRILKLALQSHIRSTYHKKRYAGGASAGPRKQQHKALSTQEIRSNITQLPKGKIIHIIDGDSVIIKNGRFQETIRLHAIDCPEGDQAWGEQAKYGLIKLVGGKDVYVEKHGTDQHGRTLATLHLWNASHQTPDNINEKMVARGHAWVMRRFYKNLPIDRQTKLNKLENWAKNKKIGLWRDNLAIPPWEWRKRR